MLPWPPVILDPCLQRSPWKQTWRLFGGTRSFQRMHLQQRTESKGENGVKAKKSWRTFISEKFGKFTYFSLDEMKVCQQGFPRRWFCIADVLVNLEGEISKLEARRCERCKVYRHTDKVERRNWSTLVWHRKEPGIYINMNRYCFRKRVCFIRH